MSNEARDAAMLADYEAGILTPALGIKYDLTRERVRQILEPSGAISKKKQVRRSLLFAAASEKQAKSAIVDQKKAFAVDLVKGGMSQRRAGLKVGLSAEQVSDAVHAAGVISSYGRWRKSQIASLQPERVAA